MCLYVVDSIAPPSAGLQNDKVGTRDDRGEGYRIQATGLGPRFSMKRLVDVAQALVGDVSIDLGSSNGSMPKHGLD